MLLGVEPVVEVAAVEGVVGLDVGIGAGDGVEELLGCGPSTQTITTVNSSTAATAAAAIATSRRSRGGRYVRRLSGLIAS
ncbi:MAG TPA: hypothetical protein VLV81_06635 [Acidimicrobiia bacterium]|nr:hypothetical protein [Acidimicrobiia bacterium]